MAKAYSYLRFSSPEQLKGDSLRRQFEFARKYAELNDLRLDDSVNYVDQGVSAFHGLNAEIGALKQFLLHIQAGLIEEGSYLIVESLDRISRDEILSALGIFLQIIQSGIIIVTLLDNRKYSREAVVANPTELLISLLILMRAREESATKSKRNRAAWDNKRANIGSKILTRKVPYWIKINEENGKFELIQEKSHIIKKIFAMAAKGKSSLEIARHLNDKKIPVLGKADFWKQSEVYKMLTNRAVTGEITLKIQELVDGRMKAVPIEKINRYYPRVINSKTFEKINGLRIKRDPSAKSLEIRNVFGYLARCPLCNSSMNLSNSKAGYLTCRRASNSSSCTCKIVRYYQLEKALIDNIEEIIGSVPNKITSFNQLRAINNEMHKMRKLVEVMSKSKRSKQPVTIQRIREAENNIEKLSQMKDEIMNFSCDEKSLMVNLDRLSNLLKADQKNRKEINSLMRKLFRHVVIDYTNKNLIFEWFNGNRIIVKYF